MADTHELYDLIGRVDGGELTASTHGYPYSIIFPPAQAPTVVYTTKAHVARELLAWPGDEVSVGIIGRYGLTGIEDIPAIRGIIGDRPLFFLGDCDPFDLLVFAWVRQLLPIRFLGTSDAVVSALGVRVTESITIALTDDEQRALSLVGEVFPDYATFVGPGCSELLGRNRKIELEALLSYRTLPNSGVLDLLQ